MDTLLSLSLAACILLSCQGLPVNDGGLVNDDAISVTLRSQHLETTGRIRWAVSENVAHWVASETAFVLVDMWSSHHCPSAVERIEPIAVMMNRTVTAAREQGVHIIHAPSGCTASYPTLPARTYVKNLKNWTLPERQNHSNPVFPILAPDGGCDVKDGQAADGPYEISTLYIDKSDAMVEDDGGQEIYNVLMDRGIKHIVYMGVHENMCIMGRSFAIKNTVEWGFGVALARDLVDSMYDPTQSPYVSHEEGTAIMTAFIEKFWAPTVSAYDFLCARNRYPSQPHTGCL